MPGKAGNYDPLRRMEAMRLNLSASMAVNSVSVPPHARCSFVGTV